MTTTKSSTKIDQKLLLDFYKQEMMRQLTEPLWTEMFGNYRVPDRRSRWQKLKDAIYWRTVGRLVVRFKGWLHRDCGDW